MNVRKERLNRMLQMIEDAHIKEAQPQQEIELKASIIQRMHDNYSHMSMDKQAWLFAIAFTATCLIVTGMIM